MSNPAQAEQDDFNLSADSELANRVIDCAEQNHPEYLAELLRTDGLAKIVRARIDRYIALFVRLQEARPNADDETLDEIARDELGTVNPNWQTVKRLTRDEKRLLKAFCRRHRI